jgi:hypothetical protein
MFPTVTAFLTHLKYRHAAADPHDHRVETRGVWSEETTKVLSLQDASRGPMRKGN